MSNPDLQLPNQPGADFRQHLNRVLAAILSHHFGADEPAQTWPGMFWARKIGAAGSELLVRSDDDQRWVGGFSEFSAGTPLIFPAATAPVGWTKITTHNDKALRVVSGEGGGSGGANAFTAALNTARAVSVTVNNHTLATAQTPSHRHEIRFSGYSSGDGDSRYGGEADRSRSKNTEFAGGGEGHNHGASGSLNINVAYVDVIICRKD